MSNFIKTKEELEVQKEVLKTLQLILKHQEITTGEELGEEDIDSNNN
jgi:hypothetical protein